MNRFPYAFLVAEHDSRHSRVAHIGADGGVCGAHRTRSLPLDLHRLEDGSVYASSNEEILHLDTRLGLLWRYEPERHPVFSCQAAENGGVIIGNTGSGCIEEIARDGVVRRAMPFPVAADCRPRYNMFRLIRPVAGDRLLVACFHDRRLAEFDWSGRVHWQCALEGTPYHPLRLGNGHTLVSLGPSGLIVEVDRCGSVVWRYDMVKDSGLECGWIAGLSLPQPDRLVYSDSRHDRLVEIDRQTSRAVSIFQDRDVLLHPSTHVILES